VNSLSLEMEKGFLDFEMRLERREECQYFKYAPYFSLLVRTWTVGSSMITGLREYRESVGISWDSLKIPTG
jgi:hypothetical protein